MKEQIMKKLIGLIIGLMIGVSAFADGFDGYNAKQDNRLKRIYDNIVDELLYLSNDDSDRQREIEHQNELKREREEQIAKRNKEQQEIDEIFAKLEREKEEDRKRLDEELAWIRNMGK